MSEVKRYSLKQNPPFGGQLEYDKSGEWIRYADYTTLSQQLATARAEIETLNAERRRDALAGQAALDEANNEIIRLRSDNNTGSAHEG